jgi:hypothetical protein
MPDRITREHVEARCANLNRRMVQRGSIVRYSIEQRNSYTAIDRHHIDPLATDVEWPRNWQMVSHVFAGTKREVADFLHAGMTVLDDATFTPA